MSTPSPPRPTCCLLLPHPLPCRHTRRGGLLDERLQRVRPHPRVDPLRGAQAYKRHALVEQLEQQRVDGRVSVRTQQHALPGRGQRARRRSDQSRLARPRHAEHQRVVLARHDFRDGAPLAAVEPLETASSAGSCGGNASDEEVEGGEGRTAKRGGLRSTISESRREGAPGVGGGFGSGGFGGFGGGSCCSSF